MKIHPEMRELVEIEMREGLRYWRDKSPEDIKASLDKKLMADQKVLHGAGRHGLAWRWDYVGCTCYMFVGHAPWCEGSRKLVFFTPEPEKRKGIEHNGRMWFTSPWMPPFGYDPDEEDEK